jgi:hypothetical protein
MLKTRKKQGDNNENGHRIPVEEAWTRREQNKRKNLFSTVCVEKYIKS